MIKVGDLVVVDDVTHIVTSTVNGESRGSKPLREYIMNTRVVKYDGEWKSIKEVIDSNEQKYIDAMGGVKECPSIHNQ